MPAISKNILNFRGLAGRIWGRYPFWAVSRIIIGWDFIRVLVGLVPKFQVDVSIRASVCGGLE